MPNGRPEFPFSQNSKVRAPDGLWVDLRNCRPAPNWLVSDNERAKNRQTAKARNPGCAGRTAGIRGGPETGRWTSSRRSKAVERLLARLECREGSFTAFRHCFPQRQCSQPWRGNRILCCNLVGADTRSCSWSGDRTGCGQGRFIRADFRADGNSIDRTLQSRAGRSCRSIRWHTCCNVGMVTLLATASGVFGEMQLALNVIWRVEPKEMSLSRIVRAGAASFGLVAALGFLLLVSLGASAAISALADVLNAYLPFIASTINTVVSFIMTAALFAAIYKLLPDRSLRWSDVVFGGLVTAACSPSGSRSLDGISARAPQRRPMELLADC